MNDINKLLDNFDKIEKLHLLIDLEHKTVFLSDIDSINLYFYNLTEEIQNQLDVLFFEAKDETINRFIKKILNSKESLNNIDFGLKLHIHPNEEVEYTIDPEEIKELNNIKIKYLDILLNHIYLNLNSSLSKNRIKLKTNLTVKEIAYLFRALYEEGIIDVKHKTDIFNFIAENFSSKQKEDVSANSIKNAFDVPDFNAIDFWQEKFYHLGHRAKKDKEK